MAGKFIETNKFIQNQLITRQACCFIIQRKLKDQKWVIGIFQVKLEKSTEADALLNEFERVQYIEDN
jgi:hypothetical protein